MPDVPEEPLRTYLPGRRQNPFDNTVDGFADEIDAKFGRRDEKIEQLEQGIGDVTDPGIASLLEDDESESSAAALARVKTDLEKTSGSVLAPVVAAQNLAGVTDPGPVRDAVDGRAVAAVDGELDDTGSDTHGKVADIADGVVGDEAASVTQGRSQRLAADDLSRTVVATGHSLLYGQDTTASGTTPATNGATQTRSSMPTTTALSTQMGFTSHGSRTVVNQAYPGDRTTEAINRWAGGVSGDVEVFWLDVNDAKDLANRGGILTDEQTRDNMWTLIRRARERGADVIVVGGTSLGSTNPRNSAQVFASAQTERTMAERIGARYVDAGELLRDFAGSGLYWTDNTHLVSNAYSLIGARLAALFGPKGINPPKVAPGQRIDWRDQLHVGGTETTRTNLGISDRVINVASGGTVALSYEVTAPVAVRVRLRVIEDCTIELFTNFQHNRLPNRYNLRRHTGREEVVWLLAPPCVSPGPAAMVLRTVGGQVDVVSWDFVSPPAPSGMSGVTPLRLPVVGGLSTLRASATWDAALDLDSTIPVRTNVGAVIQHAWEFAGALGPTDSGVLLAESVRQTTSTGVISDALVHTGLMIFRRGADLRVRSLVDGTVVGSDATVAGVFAATGLVQAVIGCDFNATGDLLIYLNGTLVNTITAPAYQMLTAGVIAGATTGNPHADMRGHVR